MPHKPGIGAIFGIASEDGVAKVTSPVRLYDRTNGALVSAQFTDDNGGFTFNGLNPDTSDYMVVATDEDGSPPKNAIIRDRIQPVAGYQGSVYWQNWQYLSSQLGSIARLTGVQDAHGDFMVDYPSAPNMRWLGTQPLQQASITPGAPHLPSLNMSGGKVNVPARSSIASNSTKIYPYQQNPGQAAFEIVADFEDKDFQCVVSSFGTNADSVTSGQSSYSTYFMLKYVGATKQLTLYGPSSDYSNSLGYYVRLVGSAIDMSANLGVHHLVVNIALGSSIDLYMDGALNTSISDAGNFSYFPNTYTDTGNNYSFAGIFITGNGVNTFPAASGTNAILGPMSFYSGLLTAQNISDLYNALMVGVTPKLTGYAKDVVADFPKLYFRLNDAAGTYIKSSLTASTVEVVTHYGSGAAFQQPTLIAGGMGIAFSGNDCFYSAYNGGQSCSQYGYTLGMLVKPTNATPAAMETLFWVGNSADTTYIRLDRMTDGSLQLTHQASGNEVLNFNTALANFTTERFVDIVVDKIAKTATLYLDGAPAQTIPTNTNILSLYIGYSEALYQQRLRIGGFWTGSVVNNGFTGRLSEVYLSPLVLSAARIASHYNARNTA